MKLSARGRTAALTLAVVALSTGRAAANMAAPPRPAKIGSLGAASGPTPLEVVSDDLVIDCAPDPAACRLKVTYQLRNAGTAAATGVAAFYAIDTDDVAVTVDGQPASHELGEADAAAFDASVRAASGDPDLELSADDYGLSRHGFDLALEPGATAQVVVTGTIHPRDRHRYYMSEPAAPARHRLFVRGGRTDRRIRIRYFVAPIRTWSGFPAEMTVTISHPARWRADVAGLDGASEEHHGGVVIRHGRVSTKDAALEIELSMSAGLPIHGGLVLGLGGQVDDADGVRVRVAAEAGRGAYLASLGLELERGYDETGAVIVPAVEIASPWVIFIPSIGLGVGVPIRLKPTAEVGARFLADAHFGPVGLMMAIDYYPGMAADPRRYSVALLGQLSL